MLAEAEGAGAGGLVFPLPTQYRDDMWPRGGQSAVSAREPSLMRVRSRGNGRLDPAHPLLAGLRWSLRQRTNAGQCHTVARVGEGLGGDRDSAGGAGDAWPVRLVWQEDPAEDRDARAFLR